MRQKLVPVNQEKLLRGRAPSGMPKLAKNPDYKPPKKLAKKRPAKRKPVARKPVEQKVETTPKKLPPMRKSSDLSRQAKEQPRDRSGKFVPVDQRGFFGKVRAYFNGEMRHYIGQCGEENYHAFREAHKKGNKL